MGMAAADFCGSNKLACDLSPDCSQFHVLAVDDSVIDRKLIERLLKTSSFQVTTVDSGSKALEFLGWHDDDGDEEDERIISNETSVSPKSHQEVEVNLVITDYCMPGMTGYDLLKKIKESSYLRNIPVVIMSSENVPSRITRCLEEGAEEFLLKPVRLSDLNKLRPHMMKTKFRDIQKPQNLEKLQSPTAEAKAEAEAEQIQQQAQTNSNNNSNNNNNNNNNKRKSSEEVLSPDRTRQRYNGFTVMSI